MADSKSPLVLLLKSLALVCLVVLSYTGLLYATFLSGRDQNNYILANVDKMRLLKDTPSPRMIFIGGSNLAFGLDSAKVRQTFGMPVINMGLHASFGLKFMLDQVKPYLKHGDVVVVAPEYQHFVDTAFWGDGTLLQLAEYTFQWRILLKAMPMKQLADSLLQLNGSVFGWKPKRLQEAATTWNYARSGFNSEGDEISHLVQPNHPILSAVPLGTVINYQAAQYLTDFIADNSVKGITTLVIYPCLEMSYYRDNAIAVQMVANMLSEKKIQVLSTPQGFVFADDLFFDTIYHLNARGRQLRTEKMIQVLSKALPKVLKQH